MDKVIGNGCAAYGRAFPGLPHANIDRTCRMSKNSAYKLNILSVRSLTVVALARERTKCGKYLLPLLACSAFFGLTPFAHASTISLDLNSAVLTGGASVIGGPKIKFDPNTPGQTATFTIPSVSGMQYSISVTGQNDQSSSFFQFFVDADGPGPGGFAQLGSNTNFGHGFTTITLPTSLTPAPRISLRSSTVVQVTARGRFRRSPLGR